ncbi:MAG: class II fructose-bisphosphatase [Actinomycetota bacterium]|nr:class II fructose-bisphosphatase [Actinomycetota bacterium]
MAAARRQGRGDPQEVDRAAVDAMRQMLSTVEMDGVIVIGEGEKDQAPMLFNGEQVGNGRPPLVDVAVDPVEGTRPTAQGLPGAIAVIGLSERGSMYAPGSLVYMDKIAVGEQAAGRIDLEAPVEENLRRVAKASGKELGELTAIILDRPRNEPYVKAVRQAGARIRLIRDGDVAAAIAAAVPDTGIDILFGIGGSPEAVIAAAALRCLQGEIQCRLWPRDDRERAYAKEHGLDLDQVMTTRDLVGSENVFFAATGITGGEFLDAVKFFAGGAETHSVVMRSKTGTVRFIRARHRFAKLKEILDD